MQILPKLRQELLFLSLTIPRWAGNIQRLVGQVPTAGETAAVNCGHIPNSFAPVRGYKDAPEQRRLGTGRRDPHAQPTGTGSKGQDRQQAILLLGWSPVPGGPASTLLTCLITCYIQSWG